MKALKNSEFYKFILVTKHQSPYEEKQMPPSYSIPGQDTIREDGKLRRIKYVPNETSIYVDEQFDKDAIPSFPEFVDGVLLVRPSDDMVVEYMRKSSYNLGNKERDPSKPALFKEYIESEVASEALKRDMQIFEVQKLIFEMGTDKVVPIARVALGSQAIDADINVVRIRLKKWAEQKPEEFIKLFNDPRVERIDRVIEAEEMGVIYFARNSWRMNKSDTVIVSCPSSVDRYHHLATLSFENEHKEDWAAIYAQVQSMKGRKSPVKVDVNEITTEEKSAVMELTTLELVKKMKDLEIISWAPGKGFVNAEEKEVAGNNEELVKKLEENEQFLKESRNAVAIKSRK